MDIGYEDADIKLVRELIMFILHGLRMSDDNLPVLKCLIIDLLGVGTQFRC
jgi:hypothetical protein